MIAVFVAALALMGAPANTQVQCVPSLEQANGDLGVTFMSQRPRVIYLGQTVCGGILLATMSRRERARTEDLNRRLGPDVIEAEGLLVLLHEAAHASGIYSETTAECYAMRMLPRFLLRYGYGELQLRAAYDFDLALPPAYHTHTCV